MRYGYARVSTLQQDTALQRAAFKRSGVREVIEEKRSAGGSLPLRDAMLAKLGPGDVVVVYKMDRLARSLVDLLRVLERIAAAGASFLSLTEPIDTSSLVGVLMLQLLGAVAQFERGLIRERCAAGRATAKARGVRFGRPPKLKLSDVRAAVEAGESQASIARRMGVHPSSVCRAVAAAYGRPRLLLRPGENGPC